MKLPQFRVRTVNKLSADFRRWLQVFVLISTVTGCASTNDNISRQVTRIDRAVEDARSEVILANIVRASEYYPLSFTAVTGVHGSNAVTGSLGIPNLDVGPTVAPTGKQYIFGPNSVGASNSTAFDQSILQTSEFYKGLLTPVTLNTINLFLSQGYPREVVFYLFVDHIRVRQGSQWFEYANDPLAATFPIFQKYLQAAIELGLTTDVVSIKHEDARIKEHLTIDSYIKIAMAKLQAHVDSTTDEVIVESTKQTAQLCFNSALAKNPAPNIRPVCGDLAHGLTGGNIRLQTEQGDFEIEIIPRSTYSIFSYLGRIVSANEAGKVMLVSDDAKIGADALLFGLAASNKDCAMETEYRGKKFCVAANAPNSMRVISALMELMVLSTSVNDLPLSQTIRITP